MKSVWNDIKKNHFEALDGDISTDVLIIGGGMCGIMCAYLMQKAGVDYVLAESGEICSGITNDTTAKVTIQHGLIYSKLINSYGMEMAQMYYESQKKAFDMIKEITSGMDVDFEICDSYVYSVNDREKIQKEVEALNKIGSIGTFHERTELPFPVSGAVKIENQGKFHPLKFAYSVSKDLNIYENTKVLGLKPGFAITNNGKIKAKKIIVASHFPFINKHGGFFMKMYQHRSYVLSLEGADNIKDMYVDEKETGMSLRSYKDLLLLGGGGHRTGKMGGNWNELIRFSKKYYPDARIVERWATQDCITLDNVPYIGNYSKSTPDLYVATGFNKWGMTSSVVSGMILSDMILKGRSEYQSLYSPSRSILHPQLAINIWEAAKSTFTFSAPRCPHLGCALKYNRQEHSWDCPCHGSRFERDGKLINGPATGDKDL